MIKGRLKRGNAMFVVRIEHYITLETFATALAENFYGKNESFPKKLTKKEAEAILKYRLFFEGNNGELEDGYFEASYEEGEIFNAIYSDCLTFVKSKYPWLSENES
jgi:hypothetical protein